ncbi:C-C motif chemokine 25 isoform X1 [Suricata suricatta]|uniref:C-C motif chemokine 25 isoform X1 n=1 Tax=Suricata suricatta TaxID=37032 RepID=UPI0011556A11|nr:C-C motif chemokine 25 isoform X1 [Suricata suricatta]XP_029773488.1 C-C motif chemokine 25 isoform X1 [Suricata suricatta]XP_029773489.1 C-C motif chemokine 25 isoform X1 [Suricata suricatta]
MNSWPLLCLVVASFAGIWCLTVHAQGVSEDCCLAYHQLHNLDFLRHAVGYQRQEVSGSCNLPAVIFFFRKHKMVCGNPRDKRIKCWMDFLDARKHLKRHRSILRSFQDCSSRGRKPSPEPANLPLSKLSKHTRGNRTKTAFTPAARPGAPASLSFRRNLSVHA